MENRLTFLEQQQQHRLNDSTLTAPPDANEPPETLTGMTLDPRPSTPLLTRLQTPVFTTPGQGGNGAFPNLQADQSLLGLSGLADVLNASVATVVNTTGTDAEVDVLGDLIIDESRSQ